MSLIQISPTDEADATVLMNNFNDLDNRVNNVQGQMSSVQSSFTTIVTNTLSVYQNINTLETSETISLGIDTVNKITPTGDVTFSLPPVTDATKYHQILVFVKITSDFVSGSYTIDEGTDYYFNKTLPDFTSEGTYDLVYEYNPLVSKWQCGSVVTGEL